MDDGFEKMIRDMTTPSAEQIKAKQVHDMYTAEMGEYIDHGNGEWDDFREEWPKVGWKFHLNVSPRNVHRAATFLKTMGANHKYLSGGEPDVGKVFTVYTGSKQMTEKAVKKISDNIGNILEEPEDLNLSGEALFAPRIVGRFEGEGDRFLRKASLKGITPSRERPDTTEENIEYARTVHQNLYGDYFGGGIKYYDPAAEALERHFKKQA